MNGKDRFFIAVTIFLIVIVIFFFMEKGEREKRYQDIFFLSPHSHYLVRAFSAKEFSIAQEGQLGKIHHCLTQYRSGLDKRAPEAATGSSGYMELTVDFYKIYLGINQGEVTSVRLYKYDSDGDYVYQSGTVAVNCNVKLLNAFD
ncbi:hypothetical protein ABF162_08470 [Vibrio coralliilyticus]|uniref:hypothetical protein n=1 Tax=Vibrio coralliilyticus TaxID=190893 RepID=UPI00068A09E5|nr:hypothetical protein [Vibrio coralliilyticus]